MELFIFWMTFEPIHVGEIFRTSRRALVLQERFSTYVGDHSAIEFEVFAVSNDFSKFNAIDFGEDLDEMWFDAHPIAVAVLGKQAFAHSVRGNRSAEPNERSKDATGVIGGRSDQDIQVVGSTAMAM